MGLLLQGLPPPPPRPDAASIAPTPTPAQQTPTAPSHEPSAEQEPEQSSSQEEQQQQLPQEKDTSSDQPVPQPAVDQNRPPVKPQRRPAAPAPQVPSCCHCSVPFGWMSCKLSKQQRIRSTVWVQLHGLCLMKATISLHKSLMSGKAKAVLLVS